MALAPAKGATTLQELQLDFIVVFKRKVNDNWSDLQSCIIFLTVLNLMGGMSVKN